MKPETYEKKPAKNNRKPTAKPTPSTNSVKATLHYDPKILNPSKKKSVEN
jgi:hypothetical protein